MATVPVSPNALHEFTSLVEEAHELLRDASDGACEDVQARIAEAENKLDTIQALVCPFMVLA